VKWYGSSTDIDDLKRAEQERAAGVTRLASVLETIDEGFFSLNEALQIDFFNAAAEHLLGHPRGDVLGKSLWDGLPELRTVELVEKLNHAREKRKPVELETRLERAPDGNAVRIRVHPQGQAAGISVFLGRVERGETRAARTDA
jgi:PAS domain S-box-containing protein